ncbi:MAG: hypothetical protein FWF59_13660 [Turicibacter sp.]|nr:hypothetical protein [Turicibacter sp.]
MNRLLILLAVIVASVLLTTFAPFFLGAALIYLIFRKKPSSSLYQTTDIPETPKPASRENRVKKKDIIDVSWKEVRHENA